MSCYSCELGVAKPSARFFEMAARRIGANSDEILFIDDSATNVDSAAAFGFHAIQWSAGERIQRLIEMMRMRGVELGEELFSDTPGDS